MIAVDTMNFWMESAMTDLEEVLKQVEYSTSQ